MTSLTCSRLIVVALLLGVVSLARSQTTNEADVQEDTETLDAIQRRLFHLERKLAQQSIAIKNLQLEVSEISDEGHQSVIVRDIISAINRGHFRFAEDKLIQLGDLAPISDIVHEVYAGSECNFGLLVNMTQSLTKIKPSYQILSTLYDEMKKNGHKRIKNLITLAKAFESEILEQANNPEDVKSPVRQIIDELKEAISVEASKFFTAAMESPKKYEYNEGVMAIVEALGNYRPGVAEAVMQRTVEGVFKTVGHGKILDAINSHENLWQRITGMEALFKQLTAAGPLPGTVVVTMASHLSDILNQTEYASLHPLMRDTAAALVASLPANARNLFFLPTFCFYNQQQDAYLLASPDSLYDKDRRNVFITPRPSNGSLPTGASWRAKLIGSELFFDSVDFPHENIYAAAINYDKKTHYMFGWLPAHNTDPQSAWTLELDGENCYLRNVHFNEYLYASDTPHMLTGLNYAFSIKKRDAACNQAFHWQITDC